MEHKKYIPQPIDVEGVELPTELYELAERIAENVHEVWAAGRVFEGWSYGPERNDHLKQHPGIVPYDELSEQEKEYDRATAFNTLKLIVSLGFKIGK
ncbi:MAG: Ryanodine receptor Ryr [Alistipes sp.]|nr:Ryanodine receptor Ryr [Alistipes sp.]